VCLHGQSDIAPSSLPSPFFSSFPLSTSRPCLWHLRFQSLGRIDGGFSSISPFLLLLFLLLSSLHSFLSKRKGTERVRVHSLLHFGKERQGERCRQADKDRPPRERQREMEGKTVRIKKRIKDLWTLGEGRGRQAWGKEGRRQTKFIIIDPHALTTQS